MTKKQKKVYMVTVLQKLDSPRGARTWGWYSDLKRAQQSVVENWTDMFENGYYKYAVIEESYEGLCNGGMSSEQWWYEAIYLSKEINSGPKILQINKPKQVKHYSHFWG